jgi:hypothetical protein
MRSWDKPGGRPAYCPGGIRREEGASAIQALAWNRRTRRPGIPARKARGGGSSSSGRNRKRQSTGPGHGGGPSRSSDEAAVMAVERRGRAIRREFTSQPGDGRNE